MKNFTIQGVWNAKNEIELNRSKSYVKTRNYISPSDLGGPMLDRYLKMIGTPPTNYYDERVLRIFDAGHLFEWIILRTLAMAGILLERQFKISLPETPDRLAIFGYGDAIIGGTPDWQQARERIKKYAVEFKLNIDEEVIEKYSMKLIDYLEKEYPRGLEERIIIEVKSINSMAFWGHKNRDENDQFLGYDHHRLQTYAYLLANPDIDQARIFYISKDDLCLQEIGIYRTETLSQAFQDDARRITEHIRTKTSPLKEDDLTFNPKKGRYESNWRVGRSVFLTKITGCKDQTEWEEKHHQELLNINRALKHLKEGKIKEEDKPYIEKYKLEEKKGGEE